MPSRQPIRCAFRRESERTAEAYPVPQQIAHWARIGRELERSPQVNHRAIAQVLAGGGSYDLLGEREQAVVRGAWAERATTLREGLNYEAEFTAAGESYSEADEDGNVIVHPARTDIATST
jgi:hypothetical protein